MSQLEAALGEADVVSGAETEFGVFASRVDECFRVYVGSGELEIADTRDDDWRELVLVTAELALERFRPPLPDPGTPWLSQLRAEPFSLLFRGPVEHPLGQGLRRVVHDQVGDYALFLVPVGQDANGIYYESIFN